MCTAELRRVLSRVRVLEAHFSAINDEERNMVSLFVFILASSTSSEAGLLNQQSKQRCPDFFTPFSPLEGVQENPKQVPEPPQLTPLNVKEQRLDSKLHLISCSPFPCLVNKPQAT